MAAVKVVQANLYRPATPLYDVKVDGKIVGQVSRTGTLPSCYRWWAQFTGEALVGRENVRLLSRRTRKEAVEALTAAL